MRGLRLGLSLGRGQAGTPAAFSIAFTGLSTDSIGLYGQVGNHAAIGYTKDPVTGTETVKWSNSSNPADAATYGTGAAPTDFTASDGSPVYLHVTDGVDTVTKSFSARYAPGTAPSVADGQSWTVDDTSVNIDASASGANLTFSYAATGLAASVSINPTTGAITGTPTAASSGTATVTATDQYGRTYVDTFTWTAALRAQATAGAALDLSFPEDSAITPVDLSQNFTENGNTLTYLLVDAPPTGLSATGATLSGTPTTVTADANYTFQGTDEYGRVTSVGHAIEITAVVVGGDAALLESGDTILLETGDRLLLEA